jgi:phosphoribosylanthranilate isomerase
VTWVKVCGLGRRVEVEAAVEAGANAVGFVSIPGSPRFVEFDRIASLAHRVPVRRVLLVADRTPQELLAAVARCGVDAVQPYGRHAAEAAEAAAAEGLFVLQPIPVTPATPPARALPGAIALYDTAAGDLQGGSGRAFDWSLLEGLGGDYVVAGGLGPDNVAGLVARLGPWGVDASSRLESSPGVKDLGKVAAFVKEAKGT